MGPGHSSSGLGGGGKATLQGGGSLPSSPSLQSASRVLPFHSLLQKWGGGGRELPKGLKAFSPKTVTIPPPATPRPQDTPLCLARLGPPPHPFPAPLSKLYPSSPGICTSRCPWGYEVACVVAPPASRYLRRICLKLQFSRKMSGETHTLTPTPAHVCLGVKRKHPNDFYCKTGNSRNVFSLPLSF